MNYRHSYHAGNFADVFKHVVLLSVIDSLLNKEKPFCYLDTHAGIGKYDLRAIEAQKTKEYEVGISELYFYQGKMPPLVDQYLAIVKNLNPAGKLIYYPGSPRIARSLLRPEDRMILSELHPTDAKILKDEFKHDSQVAVHLQDGYLGLKAFLPPTPRRGLVLIDPPYENPKEFEVIKKNVKLALTRWNEGIYLIWYPIKNRYLVEQFHRSIRSLDVKETLIAELNLYPDDSPFALNGSGLVILNPPWQLDKKLREIVPWLWRQLDKPGKGSYRIEKL